MSPFDQQCQESKVRFGQEFEGVHRWLDAFMGKPPYGMRHRRVRHHEAGIKEATGLFGELAGEVARHHIISDLKEEGWTENYPFPRDEQHYVAMGLF